MIYAAIEDLNIDIKKSWLIGDRSGDIVLANNCGLRSILVETGYAGLDRRHVVTPDFIVPNLVEAANFITHTYPILLNLCVANGANIKKGDFVFIGGLSRTGKSNFSSALKDYLNEKGLNAVVISIDRWLQSADMRKPGVMGRYHIDELDLLIKNLTSRNKQIQISLPAYDKAVRKRILGANTMLIDPQDVIIFEGTIALNFARHYEGRLIHTWFLEID
jgi:hypothetical protein